MKQTHNCLFILLFICVCLTSCQETSSGPGPVYIKWLDTGRVDTLQAPKINIVYGGDVTRVAGREGGFLDCLIWEKYYPAQKVIISRSQ